MKRHYSIGAPGRGGGDSVDRAPRLWHTDLLIFSPFFFIFLTSETAS
jgi:hypothetical protein